MDCVNIISIISINFLGRTQGGMTFDSPTIKAFSRVFAIYFWNEIKRGWYHWIWWSKSYKEKLFGNIGFVFIYAKKIDEIFFLLIFGWEYSTNYIIYGWIFFKKTLAIFLNIGIQIPRHNNPYMEDINRFLEFVYNLIGASQIWNDVHTYQNK